MIHIAGSGVLLVLLSGLIGVMARPARPLSVSEARTRRANTSRVPSTDTRWP
ncbi:hypothetical protein SAMN05444320_1011040 [Streptoalloteichus hindustanus]|uniref:Uncharacterized protein n=1 Tax=Streptoalloteichus hindustanus TaxID=2017 RepID=A0A1M4W860_STRHI|nr:hypothetical protein SAMN05444320_1011040 [Streptoalloteichus hindustanus]